MTTGSCLCDGIAWEAGGEPSLAATCHCSMCRKAHGAPFVTFAAFPDSEFRWRRGESLIARYASSAGARRPFCSVCGSALPGDAHDGTRFIPAGVLDGDLAFPQVVEMFTASRAPWVTVPSEHTAFEAAPPGFDVLELTPRQQDAPSAGAVRGSCLCSAVRWVTTEPFGIARNCHCTRCRKARAAAHTANAVGSSTGTRLTAGADRVKEYKVPGARFFVHAFCDTCGGPTPRIDEARKIAIVPMGSLDDDPGIAPSEHIWVGSKAPWFEITDAFPQYPEGPPR